MKAPVPLEELSAEVEAELARLGLAGAQADGRVSAAPDPRTIRYYQTLGLVDRPILVERQARYGRRHVLQLVAIKALQASGLPLARVQERLYGLSERELSALLSSVAQAAQAARPRVRPRIVREVPLEPGLKLLAEEGFTPRLSAELLTERIRAALAALSEGEKP